MVSLSDLTLDQFVDAVGQDRPAPGCGGAAAVSLALGAACARKALVISARRKGGAPRLIEAAERCRVISVAAMAEVQRDADNFQALLRERPRTQRPALVLEGDAEVLLALAAELRVLLGRHASAIHRDLAADAAAALALAEAFERIQSLNLAGLI
jgi:hypothetical protein